MNKNVGDVNSREASRKATGKEASGPNSRRDTSHNRNNSRLMSHNFSRLSNRVDSAGPGAQESQSRSKVDSKFRVKSNERSSMFSV